MRGKGKKKGKLVKKNALERRIKKLQKKKKKKKNTLKNNIVTEKHFFLRVSENRTDTRYKNKEIKNRNIILNTTFNSRKQVNLAS